MQIELTHDSKLDIAIGRSRLEKNWKNKEMLWSAFVHQVSTTHRTAETHGEYMIAKKGRQDEIKDIGGFVGGYLNGGRRKSGSVLHRQLVTLDIDFGTPDFWDDFLLTFTNAALVYSTHKHCPESPRLRLIMPLDRPVFADEYQAIARKIAGMLDIELFDPTTFQAERLMYWPSTSKDGEYLFEVQDGAFLSADKILDSYRDWTDSSEWPVSAKVDKIIQRNIQKQGDPLEKPGVVGAFCRTYGIAEAIETYLSDVYDACDVEGRFTYKHGSTAAGLVVYEDKYAYSHHGTDPTSGKLCNAFDLVRLHKYGLKDEDVKDDCPSNRLPSYVEMVSAATKDTKVRKQLTGERIAEAKNDFEFDVEVIEGEDEGNDEWLTELELDRKGSIVGTHNNIKIILDNDVKLKGCFAFDEFRSRKVVLKKLPWRKVDAFSKFLCDEDEQNLVIYLSTKYGILNRANTKEVLDTSIASNAFHPVRDYLKSLTWDEESRIETLFIDYMGANDTDYVRAVTKKTLVAAIARIFQPGIKFDYVLTLVGEEGLGKSSLVGKLGGEWFSDSFNFGMLHSKESYEQIQGVWLVEIGELVGLRKADVEAAKQFISKREDSFRVAYGRNTTTFRRQCIFFGSTNNPQFLREANGNRRFWPVEINQSPAIKNVFKDLDQYTIDQVWAEAVTLYRAGETLFLDREMEQAARNVQKQHTEKDDREGAIIRYLETLLPNNWDELTIFERRAYLQNRDDGDELTAVGTISRTRVCVAEIWCELLGGTIKDMNGQNTKVIHQTLQSMKGWKYLKSTRKFSLYGYQRCYCLTGSLVENT